MQAKEFSFLWPIAVLIVILVFFMFIYWQEQLSNERNLYDTRKVTIENYTYEVFEIPGERGQAYEAAKVLDIVRKNLLKILETSKRTWKQYPFSYTDKSQVLDRINRAIEILSESGSFSETIDSKDDEETSYTLHKSKIYMCIRHGYVNNNSKPSFAMYPIDQIMYPAIHEMAHVVCTKIGHGKEFLEMNGFMLSNANMIGINYSNRFDNNVYCGKDMPG